MNLHVNIDGAKSNSKVMLRDIWLASGWSILASSLSGDNTAMTTLLQIPWMCDEKKNGNRVETQLISCEVFALHHKQDCCQPLDVFTSMHSIYWAG